MHWQHIFRRTFSNALAAAALKAPLASGGGRGAKIIEKNPKILDC
jgi:hypothetical protein